MDYKDLTALTLKVAAAIMFFWYLTLVPSMVSGALKAPIFWATFFSSFLPSLINLAFAAFLFFFPATVANKLIKGENINRDKTLFATLEILVIRLIGIFYLFNGVIDLVAHISTVAFTPRYYLLMNASPPATAWTPELIGLAIATIAEIALALYLVVGAEGISQLIHRLHRGADINNYSATTNQ